MRLVLKTVLISIGFICSSINLNASETRLRSDELSDEELLVIVEPRNIISISRTGKYMMVPYKLRRTKWGVTTGLSHGRYVPQNYEPNFVRRNFTKVYENQSLMEFHLNIKRHFDVGSLGMTFGVGTYSGDGNKDIVASTLSLTPLRLGAQYTMDHLFDEPIVAPYISGGLYTVFYKEELEDKVFGGNTQASFYATAGVLMQLDWMDARAAIDAYREADIENTFLFLEARYFMKSQGNKDPNLSTFHTNLGIKIEF